MKKIPDHNTDMDNSLREIEHYRKHFYMRPYIGKRFCDTKILMVCKTFTAPDVKKCMTPDGNEFHGVDQVNSIRDKWHNDEYKDERESFLNLLVNDNDEHHHAARTWLDIGCNLEENDGWPWHHISQALSESRALKDPKLGVNDFRDVYKYLALTNYFVRPPTDGTEETEIRDEDLSPKESYQTLMAVIGKIKPQLVCFIGKDAWKDFDKQSSKNVLAPFPEVTFESFYSPFARNGGWQNNKNNQGSDRLKELFDECWLR